MRTIPIAIRVGAAAIGLLLVGGCDQEQTGAKSSSKAATQPQNIITVQAREIEDLKPVLATVRSKRVVEARVRTPGTVAMLKVLEGDHVEPGQVLGLVADPKIALRIKASDAQITAVEARLTNARLELERATELLKRGVAPQSRADQARTTFDVATNELSAAKSERAVIEKQAEEGQVLAPSTGRVLRVPVTEGSVVMAGESIATIAANDYLLRLEVPERHARFMEKGNALTIGPRGLAGTAGEKSTGRIVHIYPEIQNGRVVADAEVPSLGTYFVGERTLAWIAAGKRQAIFVPQALVFKRHGLDYVRVASAGDAVIEAVVQLGQGVQDGADGLVEVLAGLKAGDRLVQP